MKLLMNKSGVTMVELMVVLGLMGGVALLMMNHGEQGTKVTKQTRSDK